MSGIDTIERFDKAARIWGWQEDQGTGDTNMAAALAEYEAAKSALVIEMDALRLAYDMGQAFSRGEVALTQEHQAAALRAEAELSAISSAIGTTRFMDPPDGGDVTLAEQVRRMRDENAELRAGLQQIMDDDELQSHPCGPQLYGHFGRLARAALSSRSLEVE